MTRAIWLRLAVILAIVRGASPLPAEETASPLWYERSIVGMEVGPTGAQFGDSDPNDARYCADWDGREIVRGAVAAQAEYLVLWLRDGDFAYYDSRLLPKAPGLADRDPLREAVDEAAQHDLPLISYCVVQQNGHFLKTHPEWEMRGMDGRPLGRFCFNSGYLAAMKEIVAEQMAGGVDGFHIDMLDQGFGPPYGCWCETCRGLFRERYGHDMPDEIRWDQAWDEMLEFRYDTSQRFERQLTDHIKSIATTATVDYNYHGNPPFSFEVGQRPVQHAGNADFVTGETGVWGFSALGVSLNAEFYRAATPGRPYQVAIQRGVRMYHDQTTRPLNDMRWELFTLLAHGAFVTMIDKTGFDGRLDPVAYDRIGQALGEARRRREHFGQPTVYDVGLYFSSRTRDWIGRENPGRYFQSFQGAHQICSMEHLQFGVVLDENVSLKNLQQFPVVWLPGAAILSAREVDVLREYVTQGGRLLLTGHCGQFDRLGRPLEECALAGLIGARSVGRLASADNWVELFPTADNAASTEAGRLSRDLRPDWPFLVEGPATIYDPRSASASTRTYGRLRKPFRTTRQLEGRMSTEWPMSPAVPTDAPAVLVHQVGAGAVLTLAASPDFATAGEHAIVEARALVRNAYQVLRPRRRVEVAAPANVEAVVTDDAEARRLRVHFIAYNPTPRSTPSKNRPFVLPGLIEDAPIFRVRIVLEQPFRAVQHLDEKTAVQVDGQQIDAVIENVHEVLAVDY